MRNADHDWLPLYLDGELDAESARAFEMHLEACAECRAQLTQLDGLRHAIRGQALRHAAPPALRRRIADAAPTRAPSRLPWQAFALAASWTVAFVLGGLLAWTRAPTTAPAAPVASLTHDLFASHWRALAATSPVDVVSTDRHTVKPWFAGRIAASPLVQDFTAQGYPLVGGRIDYVGETRVPVLVYRHGGHLADVFVLPPGTQAATANARGYVIDATHLGGQPVAVVSDMGDNERAGLLRLLAKAGND